MPANPSIEYARLASIYDSKAATLYQNFRYSLAQVQCNGTAFGQSSLYSLAVNCSDCEDAYKDWLCAVMIPRCTDVSSGDRQHVLRDPGAKFANGSSVNLTVGHLGTARSRNQLIDTQIRPGPYKEILPCTDVCYDLVRKCPSSLGFQCPQNHLAQLSYAKRRENLLSCNYPGAVYQPSSAWSVRYDDSARFSLLYALLGFWVLSFMIYM